MSSTVFLAVLLAALLHALWNALIRVAPDRLSAMGVLTLASGLIAGAALPFLPAPTPAAWPFLAVSAVLHVGYRLFLARAYSHGELGLVYPIARGTGPLLVALASLALLGETPGPAALAGVIVITLGIGALALRGGPALLDDRRALCYALGTGVFIAAYTMTDGLGGRANGGHGLGYVAWLMVLDAPVFLAIVWARRGAAFWRAARDGIGGGLAGGAMSLGAYALVVWAMSLAPLAAVAALRETSVVFAALIGGVLLREGLGFRRLAAAGIVAGGVALLRL